MDWHSGWHMSWMTARWVMEEVLLVAFAWMPAARAAALKASAHPEHGFEPILRRRDARGEIGETEVRATAD